MLENKIIYSIYEKIDREEIADEMIDTAIHFRGIDGTVYTELNVNTGRVEVKFNADCYPYPDFDESICLCEFTTNNMEEIPVDLPEHIKNADDDVVEYYRTYGMDIIEFIDKEDLIEKLDSIKNK